MDCVTSNLLLLEVFIRSIAVGKKSKSSLMMMVMMISTDSRMYIPKILNGIFVLSTATFLRSDRDELRDVEHETLHE
jgi:hypothetical protein